MRANREVVGNCVFNVQRRKKISDRKKTRNKGRRDRKEMTTMIDISITISKIK